MTAFDKAWSVLKGANTWTSRHEQETPRVRARARADYQDMMSRNSGRKAIQPTVAEKLQQEIQRIESEKGGFQDQQQVRDFNLGNYGPSEQFPEREQSTPAEINPFMAGQPSGGGFKQQRRPISLVKPDWLLREQELSRRIHDPNWKPQE